MAGIGTPGEIVGDALLRRHPQVATSPLKPAARRYAFGHNAPPSLGRLSFRITSTETSGRALAFYLPVVHVLRHAAVPLLLGLHSHEGFNVIVDAARSTILFGRAHQPVLYHIQSGHLAPPSPPSPPASTSYYARLELALAHRQFDHASIDALLHAFAPTIFTSTDVATLREVARSAFLARNSATCPAAPATPSRLSRSPSTASLHSTYSNCARTCIRCWA